MITKSNTTIAKTIQALRACMVISISYFSFLIPHSLLTSCSNKTNRFHMEAQFQNLNQGEFYIYDPYTGQKDTIAVNDGRFVYNRDITDTLTLTILFPNFSEIAIFATPGAEVVMKGDATHLRDTEITGTKENDLLTAFRLKTNEMTPPEATDEAEKFINDNAASIVSMHLLQKFFLQGVTPDYKKAYTLCQKIHGAQPANQQAARLLTQLEALKDYADSGALPHFEAISTDGDTLTNATLSGDVNVILAWATWSYDSQSPMRPLRTMRKKHAEKLKIINICLDAAPSEGQGVLSRDSVDWPNVCDSLMWQSPILAQLGIATLPANIITDKRGNIVARNMSSNELQQKVKTMLGE